MPVDGLDFALDFLLEDLQQEIKPKRIRLGQLTSS